MGKKTQNHNTTAKLKKNEKLQGANMKKVNILEDSCVSDDQWAGMMQST